MKSLLEFNIINYVKMFEFIKIISIKVDIFHLIAAGVMPWKQGRCTDILYHRAYTTAITTHTYSDQHALNRHSVEADSGVGIVDVLFIISIGQCNSLHTSLSDCPL